MISDFLYRFRNPDDLKTELIEAGVLYGLDDHPGGARDMIIDGCERAHERPLEFEADILNQLFRGYNTSTIRLSTLADTLGSAPGMEWLGGIGVDPEVGKDEELIRERGNGGVVSTPELTAAIAEQVRPGAREMTESAVAGGVDAAYRHLAKGRPRHRLELEHAPPDWAFGRADELPRILEILEKLPGVEAHDRLYLAHESLDVDVAELLLDEPDEAVEVEDEVTA